MHSALARIAGEGPVRFDRFQADALYGVDGFYATGGAAGRGGDFVTSPEQSPEFTGCVADELDRVWRALGEPDPFVVIEGGSGVGTLCSLTFQHDPACVDALRWVMVERSDRQRETSLRRVAAEVFASRVGELPVATARDIGQMSLQAPAHIVVANELLDNLPVRVVRRGDEWQELHVGLDGASAVETWVTLDPSAARRAERHGVGIERLAPFPLADHAVAWVASALRLLRPDGRMILFDYGGTTAELAGRGLSGWLRTYVAHGHGGSPLEHVGEQDITADVPFDQLPGGPTVVTQRDWLIERGLLTRLAEMREMEQDAPSDSAASLVGRQRRRDAELLLDESGLGAFKVATWRRG